MDQLRQTRRRMRPVSLTGLLLVVACLAGCGSPEPPGNLLLITLDTTRADHLGCYGHPTATPNFDLLADEGVLIERAVAVAPLTLPSHASIMTGLYPPQHGSYRHGQADWSSGISQARRVRTAIRSPSRFAHHMEC